jgi:hypothetical protein
MNESWRKTISTDETKKKKKEKDEKSTSLDMEMVSFFKT